MLIAPIFHNSYLSPKHAESQNKQKYEIQPSTENFRKFYLNFHSHCSHAVTSTSSSKLSDVSSNKSNNIFKSAINRSISFFSKITSSSGSNTPTTTASTSSKPAGSERNRESSSSETPSECSSPDSLKTELIFFKPIIREPKTPSSAKPVLLRIPSIRSTASSNDNYINSPCPSPFFIPITPRRESAFSRVGFCDDDEPLIVKPRPTKRKPKSPLKSSVTKRTKKDVHSPPKTKSKREVSKIAVKSKVDGKTEAVARKTRSMEAKKETEDFERQIQPPAALSKKVVESKSFKAPPKKTAKEISPGKRELTRTTSDDKPKRVTRSSSMKH